MYTFEESLLELSLCDLDLNGLVDLLSVSAFMVCIVLDRGREKSVDECGFAQSRLSSNLYCIHQSTSPLGFWYTSFGVKGGGRKRISRTIIVKAAPRFATILCLLNSSQSTFSMLAERGLCSLIPLVGQLCERSAIFDPCSLPVSCGKTYIGDTNWRSGLGCSRRHCEGSEAVQPQGGDTAAGEGA